MSGPSIHNPKPTEEERALQGEQVQLLREQRDALSEQIRQQNLLAPILFKNAGIKPVYDQAGKIAGFEQIEDPSSTLRQQIEQGLLQRQADALAGNLPVDPALRRQLGEQETLLNESLRKQLGPGYATSTPGGQRLADFTKRKIELEDAARRGDLTLAEQLSLAREGGNQQILQNFLANIGGLNQMGIGGALSFGQAAAGYNSPLQFGVQNRGLRLQRDMSQEQLRLAQQQMILDNSVGVVKSALGGGGGGALGAAAFSSMKLKDAIKPVDKNEYGPWLKKVRETPIVTYKYKWEGDESARHVGPLYEMSPEEMKNPDGMTVRLLDYTGLVHAGLKGLDREVRTLRQMVTKRG